MYDEKEPVLTLTKFNKPKVIEEPDSGIIRVVRLILLEPGTFQTHPDMGVGIVSKCRHNVDIDIAKLNARIKSQIETYLPMYTSIDVRTELDNKEKYIRISIKSDQFSTSIPINTKTGMLLKDII